MAIIPDESDVRNPHPIAGGTNLLTSYTVIQVQGLRAHDNAWLALAFPYHAASLTHSVNLHSEVRVVHDEMKSSKDTAHRTSVYCVQSSFD